MKTIFKRKSFIEIFKIANRYNSVSSLINLIINQIIFCSMPILYFFNSSLGLIPTIIITILLSIIYIITMKVLWLWYIERAKHKYFMTIPLMHIQV